MREAVYCLQPAATDDVVNNYHLSLSDAPPGFLATAGKDCAVHVFDVASNYTLVNSLDEHSAAVTSVRFRCDYGMNSSPRTVMFYHLLCIIKQ